MAGEALLAAVGIPSVHHLIEPPRENLQVMQISALVPKNSAIFPRGLKRSPSVGSLHFKAKDAFKHWLESVPRGPGLLVWLTAELKSDLQQHLGCA